MARQGVFRATAKSTKKLRMSQAPLKEELKKRLTAQLQPTKQDTVHCFRKDHKDLPAGPAYCSFPDFKSILLNDRKIDFSRREITQKPNV